MSRVCQIRLARQSTGISGSTAIISPTAGEVTANDTISPPRRGAPTPAAGSAPAPCRVARNPPPWSPSRRSLSRDRWRGVPGATGSDRPRESTRSCHPPQLGELLSIDVAPWDLPESHPSNRPAPGPPSPFSVHSHPRDQRRSSTVFTPRRAAELRDPRPDRRPPACAELLVGGPRPLPSEGGARAC